MSTHLATIANRHRHTRARDALFAACVALAAMVSVATITTASQVASSAQVARH